MACLEELVPDRRGLVPVPKYSWQPSSTCYLSKGF